MIEEKIEALLSQKFTEGEFTDCFLIEIIHSNKKIEVFIDSDSGITFEKCQKTSRFLEHHIDQEGWLGEHYVLEVSSPGVGRPLKLKRQYPKNIGRRMEVTPLEGKPHVGTLLRVDEEGIVLEEEGRAREGKTKKTEPLQTRIPFENIKKAIVKVTF